MHLKLDAKMDKTQILNALKTIRDPQTGAGCGVGMVQDLALDGNNVNFTLLVPSLQMQGKEDLNFACMGAVAALYPQANVNVHFMAKTPGSQASTAPRPTSKTSSP